MRIHSHITPLQAAPSRRRSLLRDLSSGLLQQMYFWGCDVRRHDGNLLVEFGMQRIERADPKKSEGTSRYRVPWEGGLVELHGFCAGWYPQRPDVKGVLFVRHSGRLDLCDGGKPVMPGEYESPGIGGDRDAVLECAMPFVRWLVFYESWIRFTISPGYRQTCWMEYLSLEGARPWLSPGEALPWLQQFADSPASVPRARFRRKSPTPHPKPRHLHS